MAGSLCLCGPLRTRLATSFCEVGVSHKPTKLGLLFRVQFESPFLEQQGLQKGGSFLISSLTPSARKAFEVYE